MSTSTESITAGYAQQVDQSTPQTRIQTLSTIADVARADARKSEEKARSYHADAAGLITRADDPADARAVRLELTATGRETVSRAIPVVGQLLDTLLAPLGGRSSKRTEAFTRDLITLLDNPLEMKE